MNDNTPMNNPSTPKTPAQAMSVTQRGELKANGDEREMRYVPFASDTEIKLTVAIVTNLICIPTRNGARCSPQDAIKFMMMCQARKLNPFEGDAFLQGYDSSGGPTFNLITAHQAFLKRAEVNKEYDGMESGVMVLNDRGEHEIEELQGDFVPKGKTLVGGWAKVHLKHRKIPMYRRLDLNVFMKVNREGKAYGRWADDPAGMIVKCAEADALRSAFPTMLGNLYLEQELNPDNEKNVTPAPQIAAPSFITQPQPQKASELAGTSPHSLIVDDPHKPQDEDPLAEPPESQKSAPEAKTATEILKPDPTAHLDADAVTVYLTDLMKRDGVTEDQVIAHLRNTKVAKSNQTELTHLSDSKRRTLVAAWDREVVEIRKVTV